MAGGKRYSAEEVALVSRIRSALDRKAEKDAKRKKESPQSLSDFLAAYTAAEAKRALEKSHLTDAVHALLMKEARGAKPYRKVSEEERSKLYRQAMGIADTVMRAERSED